MTAAFAGLALDRTRLMAILNVTPDSFSDGGRHLDSARAVEQGLRLVCDGADLVDVGGESTRPGSQATPVEEEMRRVVPVVAGLAKRDVLVSIDTRRAVVACACIDAGARIVNDVSAGRDDPQMAGLIARTGTACVLMHRRGSAERRYAGPDYDDVVQDVRRFLLERAAALEAAGVARACIALDPGIGFGKSVAQNLALIAGAARLADCGYPLVVGASRKSFIGELTGIAEPARRDPASVWLAAEAARRGAAIVRVHDVAGTRQVLAVSRAMR